MLSNYFVFVNLFNCVSTSLPPYMTRMIVTTCVSSSGIYRTRYFLISFVIIVAVFSIHSFTRPMVSKSRSRILIPSCTQRSKNKGVVIGRSVGRTFFSTYIRLNIKSPKFNKLWKHLINGECIKSVQPLFRCIWDISICMLCHHIRNILEHTSVILLKAYFLAN